MTTVGGERPIRPGHGVESLDVHDHAGLIYETDSEREDAIGRYIRAAIDGGNRCVYMLAETSEAETRDRMHRAGLDTDEACRSGALQFVRYRDLGDITGGLEPDALGRAIDGAVAAAERDGFASLRAVGDMTWALGGRLSTEAWLRYEAGLTSILSRIPVGALCLYDRRRIDPDTLIHVVQTHPTLILHGKKCSNPHFIPPEVLLRPDRSARVVDRMLEAALEDREAQERRLDQVQRNRAVIESAPEGYLQISPEGRILDVNRSMLAMLGYTRDEVIGQPLSCFSATPDDPEPAARLAEVRQRVAVQFEARYRRKDGAAVDTLVSAYWVEQPEGPSVRFFCRDITELKGAAEALRASEQRLRKMLEGIDLAAVMFDAAGRVTFCNDYLLRLTGWSRDEVLGSDYFERFLPEDGREPVRTTFRDCMTTGSSCPSRSQYDIRTRTGERRTLAWSHTVLRDAQGRPSGGAGIGLDITERMRAERAVRESEERFRELAEMLPEVVFETDAEGTLTFVNQRSHAITGYTREDFERGLSVFETVAPEDRDRARASVERVLRGESLGGNEYVIRRKDGSRFTAIIRSSVIYRDGRPAGLRGILIDITERKHAEERLRSAHILLESLVQSSPVAIINLDAEGRVRLWSPAAERMFGWTAEEVLGRPLPTVPPEGAAEFEAFMKEIATGRAFTAIDRVRVRKDGKRLLVSLSAAPLLDSEGRLTGIVGLQADVSEQRAAEKERRALEAKIQQTQKLESLGVLAGGIAHDFNNLLTGILGNANLAALEVPPQSPAAESILQIEIAARRAAELTGQLLAYSGRGRFHITRIDLTQLIREMAHLLDVSISKKCTLRYNFAPDLPAVEADATQVRQIVMNLIINASEAMGDRPGVITLSTSSLQCDRAYLAEAWLDDDLPEGPYVCLEVADTGCGMGPETQRRIFEPFFSTKFTGRGLGLAAVLGIVRSHRGVVRVYSELGRGSTFRILLPASASASEPLPVGASAESDGRSKGTVLVVDDEEAVRRLAQRMLERAGFTVLAASDGVEAVEVFREHADSVCAVLLDMTMPRMDGEEAFRALRRIRPDVRVVLTSGFSEQDATHRFVGKSLAGFIQKPYAMAQLVAVMRKAVEE